MAILVKSLFAENDGLSVGPNILPDETRCVERDQMHNFSTNSPLGGREVCVAFVVYYTYRRGRPN